MCLPDSPDSPDSLDSQCFIHGTRSSRPSSSVTKHNKCRYPMQTLAFFLWVPYICENGHLLHS